MRFVFFALSVVALLANLAVYPASAAALGNSRQGCLNQWLFNGVWRAKITKVEPIMDGARQTGWQVTQVWRNGTSRELAPADSSFKTEDLQLSSQSLEGEGHKQQVLVFNTMAPSGELTYTQTFFGPNMSVDPNDKPKALDITFDNAVVSQSNKPHFSSRQYNFHYNLTCVATGSTAQAEGGSSQLTAVNGCMNQWMSNGVWKMRVLAVTPNPPGTQAKDQNGWLIKQEWVNATRTKVFIGGLGDESRRIAPTNVMDEFLATKSGNNSSSANVAGGFAFGEKTTPFEPGVPHTFEQLIAGGNLSAADSPTRVLVAFDTDTQKKTKLSIPVPQYHMPANFRISLTCGGTVTMAPGLEALQTAPPAQQPAPAPPPQTQQVASAATSAPQSNGSGLRVDPCAMLSTSDVASALGVGVRSLGAAQHPSANECAWAVASHASGATRNVLLVMQPVASKTACHGFGCLSVVQSVLGSHGLPGLPSQFSDAFTDAQMISGLGDKASWKDGRLTVLRADMAFQLLVHGSGSPALNASEALARDVLYRVATP